MRRGRASGVGGCHFVTLSVFPSTFPIFPFGTNSANQQFPSLSSTRPYAEGISLIWVNFCVFGSKTVSGPPVAHILPCASIRSVCLDPPANVPSLPGIYASWYSVIVRVEGSHRPILFEP